MEAKFANLAPGFTRSKPTNWCVKPDGIVIYYQLTIWNEDESFEESYKGKLFINYIIIYFLPEAEIRMTFNNENERMINKYFVGDIYDLMI